MGLTKCYEFDNIDSGPGTVNADGSPPRPFPEDLAVVTNQPGYHHLGQVNAILGGKPITAWVGYPEEGDYLEWAALACPPIIIQLKYVSKEDAQAMDF